MRQTRFALLLGLGLAMLGGSYGVATWMVAKVEEAQEAQAHDALARARAAVNEFGNGDVAVTVSGLTLALTGSVEGEEARLAVLKAVSTALPSARLNDNITVMPPPVAPAAPLSVSLLADETGLSLMGMVGSEDAHSALLASFRDTDGEISTRPLTDLTERMDVEVPSTWTESLAFATQALSLVGEGRVDLSPSQTTVAARLPNETDLGQLEDQLAAVAPEHLNLTLELDLAPPVIAPFVFSLSMTEEGAVVGACACPSDADKGRITALLEAHSIDLPQDCLVGLGAPSPDWTNVVEAAVSALHSLGAGRVDITDTAVALIGAYGSTGAPFEEVEQQLTAALPELYTLTSVPPAQEMDDTPTQAPPAAFTALRSEDTAIRLRGVLTDETTRAAVRSYSEAQFGFDTVIDQTELQADLPEGWPRRVLSGIAALSLLHTGQVDVGVDSLRLTGVASALEQRQQIAFFLESSLPEGVSLSLDIAVDPSRMPVVQGGKALHVSCANQINDLLTLSRIEFSPGSSDIAEESLSLVEDIASVLERCPGARFEIGGHTDSQGRESSNMALSQSRADAVVDALLTQGLDTVYLRAVGFGETQPIADNETEDGRAQNRRIAFRLLEDEARSEVTSITIGTEAASLGSEPGAIQGTDATGQELIVIGNPQDGPPKLEADAVVTQSDVPLPRPESLSTPGDGAQEDDDG